MNGLLFIIFLLITSQALATTYYVRDGGGTISQCDGKTNVVLAGASGTNCAVNHPSWIMGTTGHDGSAAGVMIAGDTVSISGDSDIVPGSQAIYDIGYGMPNTVGVCNVSFKYYCLLANVIAGTDSTHNTKILGTGTNKPMLIGINKIYQVIDSEVNHVTLQSLEITDNSECGYNNPVEACGGPGFTGMGITASGDDLTWTDVYVHGFGEYGIYGKSFGTATFTRVWVIGNGYGGFITGADGDESITGTLTFNQPIIDWNGCVEKYPLPNTNIEDPTNYKNCFGQENGGYGDGLAFGATTGLAPGNWTIIGPGSISWNTQDGWDILHGNLSGTDSIDKMRIEGNAGQAIKLTGLTDNITNNIIIGDCGWWQGAAQSASGKMLYGDSCRAEGDTLLLAVTNNGVINMTNNTIFSNGLSAIDYKDTGNTGCNGSTKLNMNNNIGLGGPFWLDDSTINPANNGGNQLALWTYAAGADGNGSGTCGTLLPTEDYNIVSGFKNSNSYCSGAHDKCGTSPGFVSQIPTGTLNGNESTFYNAWSGVTYMPISNGSAAKGAGNTGYTYWNTINDYYGNTRPSISMGALEYNSAAGNAWDPCFFNSDCSSGICTANICVGSGGNSITGNGNIYSGNLTIKGITLK